MSRIRPVKATDGRHVCTVCLLVALLLCVRFACICPVAYADDDTDEALSNSVDDSIDGLDLDDFSDACSDYIDSVADKIRALAEGKFDNLSDVFALLAELFAAGLSGVLPSLLAIFAVVVIASLCRRTTDGLVGEGTQQVVGFVGVSAVVLSVLQLLRIAYGEVAALVDKIAALSQTATPIMLTMLIACGATSLGGVCQPSMAVFSSVIVELVRQAVLPLSLFATMYALAANLSGNLRVEKLSSTLANLSGWLLGVVFMLFSAFTSVQGITAGAVDAVSVRAAKFAAKNYVPILGGYVAEGFDVVLAGATLVKNSFGGVCLLVLLLALLRPVVCVTAVSLGLQAVSALSQPVADERFVKLLAAVGKNLSMLVAVVVAVAFMFALQVVIAISCANFV